MTGTAGLEIARVPLCWGRSLCQGASSHLMPRPGIAPGSVGGLAVTAASPRVLQVSFLCHHPLLELLRWGSCWSPAGLCRVCWQLREPILSVPMPARNLFSNHHAQERAQATLAAANHGLDLGLAGLFWGKGPRNWLLRPCCPQGSPVLLHAEPALCWACTRIFQQLF